jgi:hypothetical protein
VSTKRLVLGLLLCLGCAGSADQPEPFGWCCDGLCGLGADDAMLFETCSCDGVVRPVPETRGECIELEDSSGGR